MVFRIQHFSNLLIKKYKGTYQLFGSAPIVARAALYVINYKCTTILATRSRNTHMEQNKENKTKQSLVVVQVRFVTKSIFANLRGK